MTRGGMSDRAEGESRDQVSNDSPCEWLQSPCQKIQNPQIKDQRGKPTSHAMGKARASVVADQKRQGHRIVQDTIQWGGKRELKYVRHVSTPRSINPALLDVKSNKHQHGCDGEIQCSTDQLDKNKSQKHTRVESNKWLYTNKWLYSYV